MSKKCWILDSQIVFYGLEDVEDCLKHAKSYSKKHKKTLEECLVGRTEDEQRSRLLICECLRKDKTECATTSQQIRSIPNKDFSNWLSNKFSRRDRPFDYSLFSTCMREIKDLEDCTLIASADLKKCEIVTIDRKLLKFCKKYDIPCKSLIEALDELGYKFEEIEKVKKAILGKTP